MCHLQGGLPGSLGGGGGVLQGAGSRAGWREESTLEYREDTGSLQLVPRSGSEGGGAS